MLATVQGHAGAVYGVALSGDGRLLASGGGDGTIKLWAAPSGRPLATLPGHSGVVFGVALSGAGELLASGSFDETVRLWEADSGTCLRTFRVDRRYERLDITGLTGVTAAPRAALSLFGVPILLSCALSALAVVALLARATFRRVQLAFVAVGIGVSLAYAISAVLVHPDWGRTATYLVVPHGRWTGAYLLAVVVTVGTTITPWGQAFIQSCAADKGLAPPTCGPPASILAWGRCSPHQRIGSLAHGGGAHPRLSGASYAA